MIDFGNTLRLAREAKGMTVGQLAEQTHLTRQMVEDLEHEHFARIAAPIYGRGFVRLYCEAVGLDSKPMVAEFMEILNGNREVSIRVRTETPETSPTRQTVAESSAPAIEQIAPTSATPDAKAAIPEVKPVVPEPKPAIPIAKPAIPEAKPAIPKANPAEPPPADIFTEIATASTPPPVRAPLGKRPNASQSPQPDLFSFRADAPTPPPRRAASSPSRYAPPTPLDEKPVEDAPQSDRFNLRLPHITMPSVPKPVWRIAAVLVALAAVTWITVSAVRYVYGVATTDPKRVSSAPGKPSVNDKTVTKPTATAPAKPAKRKPLPVPPLYVD